MKYVSFKPGSKDAILNVVAIARANPDYPIILQWTGGRGGGHHSYEDVHEPIIMIYEMLRQQPNLVLVMGSGLGDAEHSMPYLNGTWSQALGYASMPFDGILVASRLMIAKEAATSTAIKDLICSKPGVSPDDQATWETSYEKDAGGIITVTSELGEPIHKISNRGMRLWRELDQKYFTLPRGEPRDSAIQKDKDYIIKRVNEDFQKLYFGRTTDGRVVDLEEMTYADVLRRMVQLMFVTPEVEKKVEDDAVAAGACLELVRNECWTENGRWLDPTFKKRVETMLLRVNERYGSDTWTGVVDGKSLTKQLDVRPSAVVETFIKEHDTLLKGRLLCGEDIDFFVHICNTGGKPVNFIPVIDGSLSNWFKKDSLWYSEDLAAVPDQDPERVCILQGPVSNYFNKIRDEPAADILNSIYDGILERLGTGKGNAQVQPLADEPIAEFLSPELLSLGERVETRVDTTAAGKATVFHVTVSDGAGDLPTDLAWFQALAKHSPPWLRCLLTSDHIGDGSQWKSNLIRRLIRPITGQSITITNDPDSPMSDTMRVCGGLASTQAAKDGDQSTQMVKIFLIKDSVQENDRAFVTAANIEVHVADTPILNSSIVQGTMVLSLSYDAANASTPITLEQTQLVQSIKDFYAKLWSVTEDPTSPVNVVHTSKVTLTKGDVEKFNASIHAASTTQAGIDMAIMASWQPLISTIFHKTLKGNLLELVHLTNEFVVDDNCDSVIFKADDTIDSSLNVIGVSNGPAGQTVSVTGKVSGAGKHIVTINSEFLFRGTFVDNTAEFSESNRTSTVVIDSASLASIMCGKSWLTVSDPQSFAARKRVVFKVASESHGLAAGGATIHTKGDVYSQENEEEELGSVVGKVDFNGTAVTCPVMDFLKRYELNQDHAVFFEHGGYTVLKEAAKTLAPTENEGYSVASRDLNPIHRHPYLASLANLPDTIVHGMWSSGATRQIIAKWGANENVDLMRRFKTQFTGMVVPGETLFSDIKHIGMRKGQKIVELSTIDSSGDKVLSARAEVKTLPTAYVFTGQGSAEVNMGMDLYASSPAAKTVWDTADRHLLKTYGFSIIEIVTKNARALKIHFRGQKGAAIRKNYMSLVTTTAEHGTQQLIPEISEYSDSFTFRAPEGLLFATQFTQVALVLQEKSIFDDLKLNSIIPDMITFAGHSLGEYASLTAAGNILSIEALVDIVFLRGLVMQKAVPRDKTGRSEFGMVAANPMRVGPFFSDTMLSAIVEQISTKSGKICQVVNFNVQDLQYVVAGHIVGLETLRVVTTALNKKPALASDVDSVIEASLAEIVGNIASAKSAGKPYVMTRGTATIPLPGIDVPFHSRYLSGGVPAFRDCLKTKIDPARMKHALKKLVGHYIPNVMAKPFQVSYEYVKECYDQTQSTELKAVLDNWEAVSKTPENVGYALVVELLAFQFASPVRWIETVDHMLNVGVRRFIEIGPAPTLTNMMLTTLASGELKYGPKKKYDVLFYGREDDKNEIYFNLEDKGPGCTDALEAYKAELSAATQAAAKKEITDAGTASKDTVVEFQPAKAPVQVAAPVQVVHAPAVSASGPISDKASTSLEVLRILLAVKLGKSFGDIKDDESIKALVGGKSALQNEILGDLEKEFGSSPDAAAEMTITELAKTLGAGYSPLGPFAKGLVNKFVSSKMPGGFGMGAIKSHLTSERLVGPLTTEAILMFALLTAPKTRLDTEQEAKAYLDKATDAYGKENGVAIPHASAMVSVNVAQQPMTSMAASSGAPAQPVPDAPATALDVLAVLLAVKLNKPLSDISHNDTIKGLVGGKSAVQNEILGELEKEFPPGPDNAAEMPLQELANQLNVGYTPPGQVSQGLINKLLSSKMPGGFGAGAVRAYLAEKRMLGSQRIDGVLIHGLGMTPPARFDGDGAAQAWLNSVVDSYAAKTGVAVPVAGQGGGGGGGGVAMAAGPQVSSAELNKVMAKLKMMISDYVDASNKYLDIDDMASPRELEEETVLRKSLEGQLDSLAAEHGDYYTSGIKGKFQPKKLRTYDSFWNWAVQDAVVLVSKLMRRESWLDDPGMELARQQLLNRSSTQLVSFIQRVITLSTEAGIWRVGKWCQNLVTDLKACSSKAPCCKPQVSFTKPTVSISIDGKINYKETRRYKNEPDATKAFVGELLAGNGKPFVSLKTKASSNVNSIETNKEFTSTYFACLEEMLTKGLTFEGKVALVTGCGKGSIAVEIVKYLLEGGATVVATTSSYGSARMKYYRELYQKHGSKGSKLHIVPFNGASTADTTQLVQFIFAEGKDGLGLDLDYVIPFAALSETGRPLDSIDDKSELAHRIMTTNVLRMLGCVKKEKEARNILTRPATVILPLSPNHGLFGFDGLYAESKLGLEALMHKQESEGWKDYLNCVGAIIGWTRGTGLMSGNNMSAPGVEEKGCRTFSTQEMALGLLALLHRRVVSISDFSALWADLSGGFAAIENLSGVTQEIRAGLLAKAEFAKKKHAEDLKDQEAMSTKTASAAKASSKRARFTCEGTAFPPVPSESALEKGKVVENMIDLASTVVVVGYGEVGPWGSSRTRWEMESYGEFSIEGCIELAWITGRIKYFSGRLPTGKHHIGWVDVSSNEPVSEQSIKSLYEEDIINSAGIRIIEPERFEGYEPTKKQFLHEVVLDRNMNWVDVANKTEAEEFRTELGATSIDVRINEDGVWQIKLKRGAVISIPRAMRFDRFVAGQLPTGWDAARYGIPDDIISQVDPITLYTLVSTAEALVTAGIPDPYEFYEYVHVSEVGNTMGGGMGGMRSLTRIFHGRRTEQPVQGDILQESFINTMPAWVNMLLLSSSGPIKTPVGACATAAESVDIAVETLKSGKARVVVCGGYDDFGEEGSYEFANMKATSSADSEAAMGREPKEQCRPTTTTRGGFMESQGAGMQILMTAALALEMGCPIYAVVGLTSTATDKEGRSVPAPGRGILTTCRESPSVFGSPLLDLSYRRNNMLYELKQIEFWKQRELKLVNLEVDAVSSQESANSASGFEEERTAFIESEAKLLACRARRSWGNDFFIGRNEIAPMRGALSVWGLTIDDVAVASFHGTGTKANDKNESAVTQLQMQTLGRSEGNPLMVICQKWLTGHPKGAAAAWMMNGLIQSMNTGIVPGNRNADNISTELQGFNHLLYPNESVTRSEPILAAMLKSFGFGQAGAEILLISPNLLLGSLPEKTREQYFTRRDARQVKAFRHLQHTLTGKHNLIKVKENPPYTPDQEEAVYLDPTVRTRYDAEARCWKFNDADLSKLKVAIPLQDNTSDNSEGHALTHDRRATEALLAGLRKDHNFGIISTASDFLEQRITESTEPVDDDAAEPIADKVVKMAKSPKAQRSIDTKIKIEVTMREAAENVRQHDDKGIGIDVEPVATFKNASISFIERNFTKDEQAYCNSAAFPAASFAGRWAAKEAVIKAISSTAQVSTRGVHLFAPSTSPRTRAALFLLFCCDEALCIHHLARPVLFLSSHCMLLRWAPAGFKRSVAWRRSGTP